MEYSIETAENITKACIILHNYLCDAAQTQPETESYINPVLKDTEGAPGEWRQAVLQNQILDHQRVIDARTTPDGIAV